MRTVRLKHFVTKRVHRSNIKGRAVGGGGDKTFQKFSHLWGGVPTILLKREDNGGVATFLLLYISIAFTVCGEKSKVSFITF